MSYHELADELTVENLLTPQLQEILDYGQHIQRFTGGDLPAGIVIDNVRDHTLRCFNLAKDLPIDAEKKLKLCKIILLHDLPEIQNLRNLGLFADLTAPQKLAFPERATEIEVAESQVAQEILSPEDYLLFKEFDIAANYLQNNRAGREIPPIGGLAKILDMFDPCLLLHQCISNWASTESYDPSSLVPGRSLVYVFENSVTFAVHFNQITDDQIRNVGINLIEKLHRAIQALWNKDEVANKIPNEIEEYV